MKYQFYFSEQTDKLCKSFFPQHFPGGGTVITCDLRIQVKDGREFWTKCVQQWNIWWRISGDKKIG